MPEPFHPADDPVQIVGGEPFADFFRREYRAVLGLAFVLCRNRSDAEEVTMGAFEAALRNWPKVAGLEAPGAWVRKVVSNASVSRFRRLAAEGRVARRLSSAVEPSFLDSGVNVEVWEAVRRLPRRQAQVVALFYLDGLSRAEVAQVLGLSEESVKTHLERARTQLARELG